MPAPQASRQNIKILYAISEEITSLSDIFVNGISIENQEIAFAYTKGGVDQKEISGFDYVIYDTTADATLLSGSGHALTSPELIPKIKEVEIGFHLTNGLYHSFASGNTGGNVVEFKIEARPYLTGAWTTVKASLKIYAKSITAYKKAVLIRKPAFVVDGDSWEIKVTRLSGDSAEVGSIGDFFMSKSSISFTTFANTANRTYAGTALLALWVEDISIINNRFPEVTCKPKGMKFFVPKIDHYDPDTKAYTGTWDGTLTTSTKYTTNLSWMLYSILSDKLTKTIPVNATGTKFYTYMYSFGVPEEDLGIYSFYNFARYCDETFLSLPRYEFNKQFVEKMPRRQFIESLLSVGNAKLVRKHGLLCIVYDKKLTEDELARVPLFTPEMTDEGFEYSDTHISERYTHLAAIYEDLRNNNVVASVQADSTELVSFLKDISWLPSETSDMYFVDKFGYQASSVELPGATNHTTAVIKARGLLWDTLIGNKFVNFSGGMELSSFYEGQVIGIIDSSLAFTKKTGRIKSFTKVETVYTIVFDEEMSIADTDYIYFYLRDSSQLGEEVLTSTESFLNLFPTNVQPHTSNYAFGEHVKVSDTWDFSLIADPIENSIFAKVESNITYWTITKTDLSEDRFKIEAKVYQTEKFDFIDLSYTQAPLQQIFKNLNKVTNVVPSFKVQEGLSSCQIFVEVVFSHTVPLTIAQRHAIVYEISVTMFDGSIQEQSIVKNLSQRDLSEIGLDRPETVTDALEVVQDHFVSFSFTYQNYGTYFIIDEETILDSFDAPFTLEIKARTFETLSGIKPSFPFRLEDSVTLNKPEGISSDSISVGL